MKYLFLFPIIFMSLFGCAQADSRNKVKSSDLKVGGRCEGCEAVYESPVAFEKLSWTDTLPGFNESDQKLELTGTIYQRDGKTPAKDVVLYIYHTDRDGLYSTRGNEKGWGKRHGHLRGWIKTNENGQYRFYTTRPASYPNSNNPQHIHPTIKEPGFQEYYIDEFVFEDDPLLNLDNLKRSEKRGGDGLLKPVIENGIWKAKKDIVLGLNVPGYPANGQ